MKYEQDFIEVLFITMSVAGMRNEEEVLENALEGYKEYKTRVRYKVIPFIW